MISRRGFLWLAVLIAVCGMAYPAPAAAADDCGACVTCSAPLVRPQDQVWAVNTRHMGSACCPDSCGDIRIMHYDGCQRWSPADVGQFYATDDPAAITVIYVHAARVDQEDVTPRAMALYRNLLAGSSDTAPLRLVVWCWPADKTRRPIQDYRRMVHRADSEACYLGRFLSGIRADVKVSLVGYSMGARIITGSLHLLGGGHIAGCRLGDDAAGKEIRARVVLWAPAVHSDWLYVGRPHEKAVVPLDHMLVLYNSCDPVLARYPQYAALEECYSPSALGYVGITSPARLGDAQSRITAKDAACAVGRQHQFTEFIASPWVMQNTRHWTLWQEVGTGGQGTADRDQDSAASVGASVLTPDP